MYHFLKPVVMRDRAVVLACFPGRCDHNTLSNLREDLDTLSTLMEGGVVLLVATQLDEMIKNPQVLRSAGGDLDALCAASAEVQSLRSLWEGELVPLCSQYRGSLRIDTRFLVVSCVEGFESTLEVLRQRLRENVEQVFFFFFLFFLPFPL